MNNLVRKDLQTFNAYSSARDEAKQGIIFLNANESPYKNKINRYPEKQPDALVKIISTLFNVKQNQLALSRGSDEGIDLLIRLFCDAGQDSIMLCTPTYGMYSIYAKLQGAKIVDVPLLKEKNYQLDVDSILSTWNKNIKIIFLCSPNNPTGNLLNREDILFLCKSLSEKCMIVVDEAYIEFANAESLASDINQFNNLVVLRTASKAYGMAGTRLGFLLANEYLIQWILKIIAPYPLAAPVIEIAVDNFSKNNLIKIKKQIACIQSERDRLRNSLQKIPFIKKIWPSDANFLLVKMDDSESIMKKCSNQGIILRSMFDKKGLENCIRISIGTPEENSQLINLLEEKNT